MKGQSLQGTDRQAIKLSKILDIFKDEYRNLYKVAYFPR